VKIQSNEYLTLALPILSYLYLLTIQVVDNSRLLL
jgi:hypothetical protein